MKTTQVAAALIWQGDRFMICRRPANKGNAFYGSSSAESSNRARRISRHSFVNAARSSV